MQSVRKDEIMLSELDQKRIDHLHKLLKKEEKTNQDAAAALRWAIFSLEQHNRQQSSTDQIFQFAIKSEAEINSIMDTGAFNEIVKGYLVIVMRAANAGYGEIQEAVIALDDIFDITDADSARKAYREL